MYLMEMESDLQNINEALLVLDGCQARLVYAESRHGQGACPVDALMGEMLGCEGIADMAAAAWRGIKAMLKKIYDFFAGIVRAIGGLFSRRSRAEKAFDAVKKEVDNIDWGAFDKKLKEDIKRQTAEISKSIKETVINADPKLIPPDPASGMARFSERCAAIAEGISKQFEDLSTGESGAKAPKQPPTPEEIQAAKDELYEHRKKGMREQADFALERCYGYDGKPPKPFRVEEVTHKGEPCTQSRYMKSWVTDDNGEIAGFIFLAIAQSKKDPEWIVDVYDITTSIPSVVKDAIKHYGLGPSDTAQTANIMDAIERSKEFTAGLDPRRLESANKNVRKVIDQFERLREDVMAKAEAGAIAREYFNIIVAEIDSVVNSLAKVMSEGARTSARDTKLHLRSSTMAMEHVTKIINANK